MQAGRFRGRRIGRAGLVRFAVGAVACITAGSLSGCHYDFDKSTIDQSGVSGVAPLDGGGFSFAIYPCTDDEIARLELVVKGLEGTEYILYTTVLRAEFDPPRPARELLISTAPNYQPPVGVRVEVLDSVALDRFNNDHEYLTSWSTKKYFSVNAWDRNGVALPMGSSLESRFEAKPGQLVLADSYIGSLDKITCASENTPAWHPGDN